MHDIFGWIRCVSVLVLCTHPVQLKFPCCDNDIDDDDDDLTCRLAMLTKCSTWFLTSRYTTAYYAGELVLRANVGYAELCSLILTRISSLAPASFATCRAISNVRQYLAEMNRVLKRFGLFIALSLHAPEALSKHMCVRCMVESVERICCVLYFVSLVLPGCLAYGKRSHAHAGLQNCGKKLRLSE